MKTPLRFLVLLAVFGTHGAFAQGTNWTWQNPLPQGNTLHAVFFIDAHTGWAVGEAGMILHTTDGGTAWTVQPSGTSLTLEALYFTDASTGWSVGGNPGVILHTTDGGATWLVQQAGVADLLRAVHFVDAQTGWVAGRKTLWHTADGGVTWTVQPTGPDTNRQFSDVYFADAQTGWLVGDSLGTQPLILHTADGGANWNWQDSGFDSTSGRDLQAVHFVDAQTGWAAGKNVTLLHTTDGGASWMPQAVGLQFGILTDVHFIDRNHGWVSTKANTLFDGKAIALTTDGGSTWTQVGTGATNDLLGVHFGSVSNGWVVGVAGEIFSTNDGGAEWATQTGGNRENIWSAQFLNADSSFVVLESGDVLRTVDGGITWTQIATGAGKTSIRQAGSPWLTFKYPRVFIKEPMIHIKPLPIFGPDGDFRWPNDDGTEWTPSSTPAPSQDNLWGGVALPGVFSFCWVVGSNGVIWRSPDTCRDWAAMTSGTTEQLNAVAMANDDLVWVVGNEGTILHTTDGGATWNPQSSGTTQDLNAVYFLDEGRGWVVGKNRTILQTTDGGATWAAQPATGSFFEFYDIDFADENNGWIVGDAGTIFRSTDGGASWTAVPSGTTTALLSIVFVDANTGWISGAGGTILRFTGGGSGVAVEALPGDVPAASMLAQNYPNPFGASTTIPFEVPEEGWVRVQVFDLMGRLVATLLDEPRPRGFHTATWSAVSTPAGVYFYRLQTSRQTVVKKMILMR